jgi:hypothetical protein
MVQSIRSRLFHLAVFWFAVWPIISVCTGAINLMENPTTREVPLWIALPGVSAGVLYLTPEFLISATILFLLSSIFFHLFRLEETTSKGCYFWEPAIAYVGLILGIALEFPAVLNNALFMPLRHTTLLCAYISISLVLIVLTLFRHGIDRPNRRLAYALIPCICFVISGWMLTKIPISGSSQIINRNSTVILGIDSLSWQMADRLRVLSDEHGGASYEHAITPGLLTNSVWTAIIEHRPVHHTGILLTFQSPDWSRSPYQLVREARKSGFQTWSFFTRQDTSYVGSIAGFDHNCSGPMGWLQDATSVAKNGSIFVPFIVSRLPLHHLLKIPPNQAGTYACDLRAVVRSILSSRDGAKPVFTVAHIGYLHDAAYPRFADLPKSYRSRLLGAQVNSLQDLGDDWQLPYVAGDVIDLRKWKVKHVQEVIAGEILNSGFLDQRNNNRLVLLSDHGNRSGLTNDNFGREDYYRVPLITFGLPARDIRIPISLLDIPNLIGLGDPSSAGPAAPAVEYVNISTREEFKTAVLGGSWKIDGRIEFKPDIKETHLRLLKAYNPFDGTVKPMFVNYSFKRQGQEPGSPPK